MMRIAAVLLVLLCGLALPAASQTQPPPPPEPGLPPSQQPPQQPAPPAGPQPPQPPAPQPPVPTEPAPPAAPALPPPTKIIPGGSIAGVHLGSTVRALRARLGAPSEVLARGDFSVYLYGRVGLIVYARQNTVAAVATTNSLFRIEGTIGVGQPAGAAREAFGGATSQGMVAGFQTEFYDERGVGFGMDRGAIASVVVFRPGEARLIATL